MFYKLMNLIIIFENRYSEDFFSGSGHDKRHDVDVDQSVVLSKYPQQVAVDFAVRCELHFDSIVIFQQNAPGRFRVPVSNSATVWIDQLFVNGIFIVIKCRMSTHQLALLFAIATFLHFQFSD